VTISTAVQISLQTSKTRALLTRNRHDNHEDGGFEALFYKLCTFPVAYPKGRYERSITLVSEATKMRMLFEQLKRTVVEKGEKAIMYTDWPVPLYVATLAATYYGFGIGNLRAGMTNIQRQNTVREFNDPKSKKFQVLVCSSRTSAAGLNLQSACSTVIIVDVLPTNANDQAAGRMHRYGQTREQSCTIYLIDRTYDMVMHSKYVDRTIAQLAGTTARVPVSEDVRTRIEKDIPDQIEVVVSKGRYTVDQAIDAIAHVQQVEQDFILSAGIRSARANNFYNDEIDPDRKLGLDYEYNYLKDIPVYKGIIEEFRRRPEEGTKDQLKTPRRKNNTRTTFEQLRANYSKINPELVSPYTTPSKGRKTGKFGQLSKLCLNFKY